MGNKASTVHHTDVETGQMGTTGELTQRMGVMGLSEEANEHPENIQAGNPVPVISTIPTAQIGQPIMVPPDGNFPQQEVTEYAPPPYSLHQTEGTENITYYQQYQQAQNDRCCGEWKWWYWILLVLALPFIIAFFFLIVGIYIVCMFYGIDISKAVT